MGPDQLHGFEKRLTTDVFPSDLTWLIPERPEGTLQDFADFHAQPIAIDYVTAGVRQWNMQFDFDEETHFRALEYLRAKRNQYTGTLQKELPPRDERPFFLCVPYCHPHEPFHVTQELWDLYEELEIELPEIPPNLADFEHPMDQMLNTFHGTHRVDLDDKEILYNMRRAYYGLVSYVDRKVGELHQALADYGLIVSNFNPADIEENIRDSLARRAIIREAMQKTGLPKWDYQPIFDANKLYWREG